MIVCSMGWGLRRYPWPGGDKLPAFAISSDRSGGILLGSGEPEGERDAKFRLNVGWRDEGDPPCGLDVDSLELFDKNPAWNLLGFDPKKLDDASGSSRLGLERGLDPCLGDCSRAR